MLVFAAGLVWGPAAAQTPEIHGFLRAHAAARLGGMDCAPVTACDLPFNEQRLQLKLEGNGLEGSLEFAAKLDLLHDAALNDSNPDVRELYADYHAEHYTLRAGRQVVTWSVGDLLFINDTFPKDWVAFFSGLPLEYLKLGSDALKLNLFSEAADVEVVLARFREDQLPDDRQFVMENPFPPSLPRSIDEPGDPEISLRISRYLGSWDGALYLSRTHYHAPALALGGGVVRGDFPRLNTYGASLSGPLWSGVLSLETGYYDSRDDPDGTDSSIENSQIRFLVGYSRQVAEDTTLGVQGYGEWMHDYDAYERTLPAGFPQRDRLRAVATLRFTQLFLHQTLKFNVFAFWGLSEDDGYIIPSAHYAFSDALWGELGANLFVGDRNGQFGSLGDNDNLYLTLRYAF
ncbi:MAG: hypothetical protein DIZ77_05625 [endosymbiont of Seepiophila jonesi]|uniref:DUF1302 domain-containing protein n=1 Tax=endosymbiont of Lamellibrachia luymesi TaxID=2200907 RepID=A0A370E0B3_9GAMM|nr:MAG: hypothetical protein DIZ79_06365 [endosymbiont of Lamellibrachia luymesi]RDH93609.1 MAG: hypothetical protein DIZ77_05625 [endosymbiont of Seepiophila jonesi]